MTRSITFVVEGHVSTNLTITENVDGTLTFDLRIADDSVQIGDLRALFFDLDGLIVEETGFAVYGSDVTDEAYSEEGVDSLGRDANIKGQVSNELGDFDVGIEFGTSGMSTDDIQATSFTLAYDPEGDGFSNLSLDMVDVADFGLRYTSVGEEGGSRGGSAKIGDQSNGVAQNDDLSVDENASAAINVLTYGVADTNAANVTVTGVRLPGAAVFAALPAAGFDLVRNGTTIAHATLLADGRLSVDADTQGADAMAAGESEEFAFEYRTTAPDGSVATATVTVTVSGLNDDPTVSAAVSATASEDDAWFYLDLLAGASDVDASDVLAVANLVLVSGDASGVTPVGTTLWVQPAVYDALAVSQSEVVTYSYDIVDCNGGTVAQTATLTITGANDVPVVSGAVTAAATEDDVPFAIDLLAGASDPDTTDVLGVANLALVSGDGSGVTANGTTLDLDPAAYSHLAMGETEVVRYSYDINDGNVGSVLQTATITIEGRNDAPRVVAVAGDSAGEILTETDAVLTASGTLTVLDPDLSDEVTVEVTEVTTAGPRGDLDDAELLTMFTIAQSSPSLAIAAEDDSGAIVWHFDSGTQSFDHLAAGEELFLYFRMRPEDGITTVPVGDGVVTIRILGTDDAPRIFAIAGEDRSFTAFDAAANLAQTGTTTIRDEDISDVVMAAVTQVVTTGDRGALTDAELLSFFSIATQFAGGVAIDGTGQQEKIAWSFDSGAEAFDHLADGETLRLSYRMTGDDGNGGPVGSGVISFDITGTNSAPVAQNDLVLTDEETVLTGNLFVDNAAGVDFDPDGDSFTIHAVDGQPAAFGTPISLSSGATLVLQANGDFTFDPRGAFDFLAEGARSADGINYTVIDSRGAVSNEVRANFSVYGVNDAPVAGDDKATLDEDTTFTLALLSNDSDADLGEYPSLAQVAGVTVSAGDVVATAHGSLTVNANGTVAYTPDAHFSGNDTFTYRATDGSALSNKATVTLTVTPVADAPTLSLSGSSDGSGIDLTPTPATTDVQVNTVTTSSQYYPAVTALSDGGYAITWDSREDGSGTIRLQIHAADGSVRVPAVLVDAPGSGTHQRSDVFQLEGDDIVVVNRGSLGADVGEPFFQRFDSDGIHLGTQQSMSLLPAETGDGDSFRDRSWDQVQGTALEGGGFVAVYSVQLREEGQPIQNRIYASIYDASGNALQQDVLIAGPGLPWNNTVSGLSGGGFVVAWSDGNTAYARLFNGAGVATSEEIAVNEWPLHTTGTPGTSSEVYVTTLENGNFVVSWSGDEVGDRTNAANFRLYAPDGTPLTGQVRANTWTGGEQEDQSVTALKDGGFLMTWTSDGQDGDGEGLFAQRFDADGNTVGSEYQVANTSIGSQQVLFGGRYTATLADGRVVTAWDQDFHLGEIFHNITEIPVAVDGVEDQPLLIALAASLVDTDGSETLAIRLSGFPTGATFNLGAPDGADWVIGNAESLDLSTLEMMPHLDYHGTFTLTVTATATETANGDTASTTVSRDFTIADVAEPPLFTNGADVVNFGNPLALSYTGITDEVAPGSFQDGTQYDALDGDDKVFLPGTAAQAASVGYDLAETFAGGAGADLIVGGAPGDVLDGGAGADLLRGEGGNDTLFGGDEADNILGGAGDDFIDGGASHSDTIQWIYSPNGVIVDIASGMATGEGNDTFVNVENFRTSQFEDIVYGSDTDGRQVRLLDGDDQFHGGSGAAWVFAGEGDDHVDGGDGADRIDYGTSGGGVTVNLGGDITLAVGGVDTFFAGGTATGEGTDTLVNVEQVFGSQLDDILIGSENNDAQSGFGIGYNGIFGRGGNDLIYGLGGDDDLSEAGDGNDSVFGGDGDDNLGGGAGDDFLDGGAGVDQAYYRNTSEAIVLDLGAGLATQGVDTDTLVSIENVAGSRGNDVIVGDSGANAIDGYLGDDTMTGGAGADSFVWVAGIAWGADRVTDFTPGEDVIRLFSSPHTTLADLGPIQVGADVVLDLGDGTLVTLEDVSLGALSDSDFSF